MPSAGWSGAALINTTRQGRWIKSTGLVVSGLANWRRAQSSSAAGEARLAIGLGAAVTISVMINIVPAAGLVT